MDEIVDFIREHLRREHEARRAALTDPAGEKTLAAIERANGAYLSPSRAGIDRPDEVGEEEKGRAQRSVERALFLVREYGEGRIYVAVVGEPYRRPYGTAFGAALFVERLAGEPKIVARYLPCPDCDASGSVGGAPCRDCRSSGWRVRETGKTIDVVALGAPTTTRRFQPPDVDRFAAAYNA